MKTKLISHRICTPYLSPLNNFFKSSLIFAKDKIKLYFKAYRINKSNSVTNSRSSSRLVNMKNISQLKSTNHSSKAYFS